MPYWRKRKEASVAVRSEKEERKKDERQAPGVLWEEKAGTGQSGTSRTVGVGLNQGRGTKNTQSMQVWQEESILQELKSNRLGEWSWGRG